MKKVNRKELWLIKLVVDLYPHDVRREIEKKKKEIKSPSDYHFGVCSVCGKSNGSLNMERAYYYVCHKHKNRWWVGANLFDSWNHELEEICQKNYEKIKDYDEITGNEWFERKFYPEFQKPESKESLAF